MPLSEYYKIRAEIEKSEPEETNQTKIEDHRIEAKADFNKLPEYMMQVCKLLNDFPDGLSASEISGKLNAKTQSIREYLNRMQLKDPEVLKTLHNAGFTKSILKFTRAKVAGRSRKVYTIAEEYKGEFVKK